MARLVGIKTGDAFKRNDPNDRNGPKEMKTACQNDTPLLTRRRVRFQSAVARVFTRRRTATDPPSFADF